MLKIKFINKSAQKLIKKIDLALSKSNLFTER